MPIISIYPKLMFAILFSYALLPEHQGTKYYSGYYFRNFYWRYYIYIYTGYAVAQLVEALRYKPGRSRVSLEFFIDIILQAALWPWGSTQPLTEMSTRNISWA